MSSVQDRGYDENKPGEVLHRSVPAQGLLAEWPEKSLRRDVALTKSQL